MWGVEKNICKGVERGRNGCMANNVLYW
jgi:hypothetical protein